MEQNRIWIKKAWNKALVKKIKRMEKGMPERFYWQREAKKNRINLYWSKYLE